MVEVPPGKGVTQVEMLGQNGWRHWSTGCLNDLANEENGPVGQFGFLLQAELDGDGQVHGHGLAIEDRRLVFPLAQCVHGCLVQERCAGDNLHRGNMPVGVDERIDAHIA
jgi:hypothetical protein